MPISIYPPTLKSTQAAFLASTTSYPIYFTLQSITSFSDIGHIQIRIVRQSNNKTIVNTSLYPDGIIYKNASAIDRTQSPTYSITINNSDLAEKWHAGYLYKVQMRFGTTSMYTSVSNFATWKQTQINASTFSEWSTVMVLKALEEPDIYIKNQDTILQDVIETESIEATTTPLFTGYCEFSSTSNELVDKYKFNLYEGEEVNEDLLIETSGWIQHDSNVDSVDTYRFKTVMTDSNYYVVTYEIESVNGYTAIAEPYIFQVVRTFLSQLEGVSIRVESDTTYCKDNGVINIYCTSDIGLVGNYLITRSDEYSNYEIWEDLVYLPYANVEMEDTLIYQDFTIESGVRYKYAFQIENSVGVRTSPLYPRSNIPHYVDFEYSYLYRDGVQLRLQFDTELTSFKHTTLRSKQDTLGDRYTHLTQNGNAYYAEFPIKGTITFHMDDDQTFFTKTSDGYYYQDELVIPADKFSVDESSRAGCDTALVNQKTVTPLTIDTNLTDNNIFVERIFREKAESFLNDFEYKLYRSATEGNIIVGLLSVSMTPKTELGRMIYTFSGTAYEVMENTLENLDEIGIIEIGEFADILADDTSSYSFGQIAGLYGENIDIYEMIREREEIALANDYREDLTRIVRLWIEQYPDKDFTGDILALYAERSDLSEADEDTTDVEAEIAETQALADQLAGPLDTVTRVSINGQEVLIAPNKVYTLSEDVTSLSLIQATAPILVNYICELVQVVDENAYIVSSIDTSRIWGQLAGVFTGTDSVLKVYDYDYDESETLRIYNKNAGDTVIYDAHGNIVVDETNYNVYKTVNILDAIKEEVQKQVELIYDTEFEEIDGELTDGSIYYEFEDTTLFDIEADAGTHLILSTNKDGSDPVDVYVGVQETVKIKHLNLATNESTSENLKALINHNNRYVLSPLDNQIKYIALAEPQFCIINYKCLTNQMKTV